MDHRDLQSNQINCPVCHRPSDSIKQYEQYKLVVFLVFAGHTQTAIYTACPSCMRKMIGRSMLVNIIPANISWLVLAVVWSFQLVGTFLNGHSEEVAVALELERAKANGGRLSDAVVDRCIRGLFLGTGIVSFMLGLFAAAGLVKDVLYLGGYRLDTLRGEYTLISEQTILLAIAICAMLRVFAGASLAIVLSTFVVINAGRLAAVVISSPVFGLSPLGTPAHDIISNLWIGTFYAGIYLYLMLVVPALRNWTFLALAYGIGAIRSFGLDWLAATGSGGLVSRGLYLVFQAAAFAAMVLLVLLTFVMEFEKSRQRQASTGSSDAFR